MKSSFTSPVLIIRPSLSSDTADVLKFCKFIWGGDDYVPYVWKDWLKDPNAQMFTAEYTGHAVGIGRLVHVAEGQWWLEGFRVDPNHQDKKIGSRLHRHMVEWWLEHGDGIVRLWTNKKRVKVHHLCAQTGFTHTQERFYFDAPALTDGGTAPFTPAKETDIPEALAFTLTASSLPLTGGMIDMGWRVATPNETSLREVMNMDESYLLWWRGRQGLVGLWPEEIDEPEKFMMISFAACDADDLGALLMDVRRFSAGLGFQKVGWHTPVQPEIAEILSSTGFTCPDEEDTNYQFERIHPLR